MTTMRAARWNVAARTLAVREVPIPEPGPGEVLVRVAACGICHTDLSVMNGSMPTPLPEVTLGHEAAGTIAGLGGLAPGWQLGQPVLLDSMRACGRCRSCQHLADSDTCHNYQVMGISFDGGWAEYVVVPTSALVAVPQGLPLEQIAVLADAVATPYSALLSSGGLRPAETVGIWGLGGLGVHAIQIARLAGAAKIIGLDPLAPARSRALTFGADHVLDPTAPDTLDQLRALTAGTGLDLAFDGVGSRHTLPQANAALSGGGRLVLVGISPDPVSLTPAQVFALSRHRLVGHLGYVHSDLEQLVALVAGQRLDLSRSVSEVIDLDQIEDGVRRLAEHDGNPIRIVVTP